MVSGSSMKAAQELVCPKCGQTDQVQKVSGLYNANTKEWYETHSSGNAGGMSQTHREIHTAHTLLGQKLAPPEKPAGNINPTIWYAGGCFLFMLVAGPICASLLPLVFLPLVLAPLSLKLSLSSEYFELGDLPAWVGIAAAAAALAGVLVCVGLLVWALRSLKRKYDASMAKYRADQARLDSEEIPRWQRAMERWENLYYCARDETIFIPGENKSVPVAQMKSYLLDPYYHPF